MYYDRLGLAARLRLFLVSQGLWALLAYRFARWVRTHRLSILGRLLWAFYRVVESRIAAITGITLDPGARIGPGFYVAHFGGIYVGAGVVIGRNCSISQMSFLGSSGPESHPGAPILGDRVYVAAAAKVVGGIRIGDGAVIGANAVAMSDVPENGVAVGNPAIVANLNGSANFIRLRNK